MAIVTSDSDQKGANGVNTPAELGTSGGEVIRVVVAGTAERGPHVTDLAGDPRPQVMGQACELSLSGCLAQSGGCWVCRPELLDALLQSLPGEQGYSALSPSSPSGRVAFQQVARRGKDVNWCHASFSWTSSLRALASLTRVRSDPPCASWAPLFRVL